MGGNAFSATKPASAFPRIPPPVYQVVKAQFFAKVSELYTYVGVPVEAPEKVDHGDIDFLVAYPKTPYAGGMNVPHNVVKQAIGAEIIVPMEGNRTSNFAVPIREGDWAPSASEDEDKRRADGGYDTIYYQVDIHVCEDRNEWDRIMFYHSYGDLGMILGLIARNIGLKLGTSGLHLLDHPNPHFLLSTEFDDIISFLGFSKSVYDDGFRTKREVFEWVASSKYFDPSRFRASGQGFRKVKQERRMYYEFVEWVQEKQSYLSADDDEVAGNSEREAKAREEALIYFGKHEVYQATVREREGKQRLKEIYTGSVVRDWTALGGNWRTVKKIMDEIRQRLGGEEGILALWEADGIDGLQKLVLEVHAELETAPGVQIHGVSNGVVGLRSLDE